MSMITKSSRANWESTFSDWTGRASDTEQRRYERTRDDIKAALRAYPALSNYHFEVYAKGSYPNFTNVVRDSDVDIAVELTDFYATDWIGNASGLGLSDVGGTPYTGSSTLKGFKDDVERAMVSYFGPSAVERGDKAIHIRESSRKLAADVVPCVTHKTYHSRISSNTGIKLRSDKAPHKDIVNYPKQHLERGTRKNDRTNRRYKRVVRILKRLENEMVDKGLIEPVPSFLIESAVWNVGDDAFNGYDWTSRVRRVLAHIFNNTRSPDCVQSENWLEANGIKYLFHADQGWTWQQLHAFADAAWDYIGFEN
jgi:hypothetical protein